jgi:hypothetical protein
MRRYTLSQRKSIDDCIKAINSVKSAEIVIMGFEMAPFILVF